MNNASNNDLKPHPPLKKSFYFAGCGILAAIREERNIKIMLVMSALTLALGCVLKLEFYDWCIIILLNGGMLFCELINTAVETVVDLASPQIHPLAKRAKDIAAGAGLVYAITSVLIGLLIYGRACLRLIIS